MNQGDVKEPAGDLSSFEIIAPEESTQIIVQHNSQNVECLGYCYPSRTAASSRGIKKDKEQAGDNNLVTFDEFFELMKRNADFTNDGGIKFE